MNKNKENKMCPHDHRCLLDYDNFEEIKLEFDKIVLLDDQVEFSRLLPIMFDKILQRYVLPPNSEQIYDYKINLMKNPPPPLTLSFPPNLNFSKTKLIEKSENLDSNSNIDRLFCIDCLECTECTEYVDCVNLPPPLNPEKYTVNPIKLWWENMQIEQKQE